MMDIETLIKKIKHENDLELQSCSDLNKIKIAYRELQERLRAADGISRLYQQAIDSANRLGFGLKHPHEVIESLAADNAQLRQCIEAAEKQEPVAYCADKPVKPNTSSRIIKLKKSSGFSMPLYAAPMPAQSVEISGGGDEHRFIDLLEFSKGWSDWLTVETYGVSIIKTETLKKALKGPSPNKVDVQMPKKLESDLDKKYYDDCYINGFNACIDEVCRLNSLPPQDSHHE